MQFDKVVEQLLNEMPYVEVSGQVFDLEGEKYKDTPELLLTKIKSILQGNKHVDKYGNTIQLQTSEEKSVFRKKIKQNNIVRKIVSGNLVDSI